MCIDEEFETARIKLESELMRLIREFEEKHRVRCSELDMGPWIDVSTWDDLAKGTGRRFVPSGGVRTEFIK